MKQRIEQFWTEAESLLNSDKKLIDKISEIENLIRERLERFELINYDAEFNLVKESGIENLANQQKEKIIKNIWNPLFNEASTFQEYSYLLNWVIPVNKWYSFCGDYELTDKTYDVLAEVIDENASLDDIIFILRSEESYNVSEKKPEAFKILAEYFMKNGDADELSGYLDPDDQHFETIRYFPYQILLQLLNKVKNAFEETDWQRILDLLEIDAEDIEGSIKNLEKKDDPVSLKEESDKTQKKEKQIASEDKVADSAKKYHELMKNISKKLTKFALNDFHEALYSNDDNKLLKFCEKYDVQFKETEMNWAYNPDGAFGLVLYFPAEKNGYEKLIKQDKGKEKFRNKIYDDAEVARDVLINKKDKYPNGSPERILAYESYLWSRYKESVELYVVEDFAPLWPPEGNNLIPRDSKKWNTRVKVSVSDRVQLRNLHDAILSKLGKEYRDAYATDEDGNFDDDKIADFHEKYVVNKEFDRVKKDDKSFKLWIEFNRA